MGELFPGISRQDSVSLSTSEAEYVAASQCGQEVLYLREILRDFFVPQLQPTCIYEDNLACIAMSENPVRRKYSRHIDIRRYFVRDWSLVVFFASLLFVLTSCLLMLSRKACGLDLPTSNIAASCLALRCLDLMILSPTVCYTLKLLLLLSLLSLLFCVCLIQRLAGWRWFGSAGNWGRDPWSRRSRRCRDGLWWTWH